MALPFPTLAAALAVLTAAAGPAGPLPHELERTHVDVRFAADGTYVIEVWNDPAWLLERLEPFSGEPLSGRLEGEARDRRLTELTPVFGRWTWIYFDGARVQPEITYVPAGTAVDRSAAAGGSAAPVTLAAMRLTGRVPEGAVEFSWAYGLVIDRYPMLLAALDGTTLTAWVEGEWESDRFPMTELVPPSRWRVVLTYLGLGFTHILPKGLDHILFVMGIYLLSTRLKPILAQVTTFTVAHTITLGLTIFGVLSLPSRVVEPLIALSIVYVALENFVTSELKPWRIALVFGFGLLHGMGFAGVLSELGLPPSERTAALLSFNLGVEGGQLAVIALMFCALGWLRHEEWYRRRAVLPISLVIAAVGLYWTVTRIVGG